MKMRKTLAALAAAAMAVSAMAVSTSAVAAGDTKIDFEDGDCSFVYMNVDDATADPSVLSVEEYDGSKQLKVDVTKTGNTPKVWFDLDKITARENTVNIYTIDLDLTFVPKNAEEAVGWAGGAIGSAGGFDLNAAGKGQVKPSWSDASWSCEDENAYNPGMAAKVHATKKFLLPTSQYTMEGTNPFFGIMRWASEVDYVMYVDNIELKDKNGNAIPLGFAAEAEAPAETEAAAPAETEAVAETPAETEAVVVEETVEEVVVEAEPSPAPVVDNTATTPVATGNASAAAVAAVMAVAGAAALISKRK